MKNAPWLPLPISVLNFPPEQRELALHFYLLAWQASYRPFVTSTRRMQRGAGAGRQTFKRTMERMEGLGLASFQSTKSGTQVTVFKMGEKAKQHTADTHLTHPSDSQLTHKRHTLATHKRATTNRVDTEEPKNGDTQLTHLNNTQLTHKRHTLATHKRTTADTPLYKRERVCESGRAPAPAHTRVYVAPEQEQPKPALNAEDYRKVGAVYAGILREHCKQKRCKIPKPEGKDGAKLSRYLEWHGAGALIGALRYFETSADCADLRAEVDKPNKLLASTRFAELMRRYKRSQSRRRREPPQKPAQPKRSAAPKRLADLKSVGEQIVSIQRGALVAGSLDRRYRQLPPGLTRDEIEGVGGDYDVFKPLRASLVYALQHGGNVDGWSWTYARAAGGEQ